MEDEVKIEGEVVAGEGEVVAPEVVEEEKAEEVIE